MRILLWFTIGFSAACVFGCYLVPIGLSALLFICLLASLLTTAVCWRHLKQEYGYPNRIAILLLGVSVGLIWWICFDALRLTHVRNVDGQVVETQITVSDFSYETTYGIAADGTVSLDGKSFRVRGYFNGQETQLKPGDVVSGKFRMRMTVRGGEKEPTYHSGNGIYLLAYSNGNVTVCSDSGKQLRYFPAYCRHWITGILEEIFPEDTQAFAKALLLGDTTDLDYETDTALRISGVRHIIAVSGLHVSILMGAIYLFGGRANASMLLIGTLALFLYAAIVGFTPSITRALIMICLLNLANPIMREYDSPTALAFAGLVQMMINPLVIRSAGFQLSFASIAGIFLFAERIKDWLHDEKRFGKAKGKSFSSRVKRLICSSIAVTSSASVFTVPLIAGYFGTVSLLGILSNLLIIWVVSFAFGGTILSCIAGIFSIPFASGIAWLTSVMIRYIIWSAKLIAQFPFAAVYTSNPYIAVWLVLCYVLLAVYLLFGKRLKHVLYIEVALFLLAVAVILSYIPSLTQKTEVAVLDVGQGQSVVLQSEGKTFLVDCGGDTGEIAADAAAEYLLSRGISKLDAVFLTHYDADHAAGMEYLPSRVTIDRVYVPQYDSTPEYGDAEIIPVEQKLTFSYGDTKLLIFPGTDADSKNDASMCILFQTKSCDILITGDRSGFGELKLLQEMEPCKLEVLVVGHHGSDSSTCELLLRTLKPETAIISVGSGNSYGLPGEELLRRLQSFGCTIRRTDLEGTVIYRG